MRLRVDGTSARAPSRTFHPVEYSTSDLSSGASTRVLRDQPWHSDTQPEKEDTMRAWSSIAAAAILALLGFFAGGGPTWAAEVKVLSSNAMTDVMTDLVPEFERTTGHKVVATFEPTTAMMNRIKAGERGDGIVLIRASLDELKKPGRIVPGSETNLATTS